MKAPTINIYSIFNSISGEVGMMPQGALVTFIRFAGCNITCTYCDTKKAIPANSGSPMTVRQIVSAVKRIGCGRVLITGGEPLMQIEGFKTLITALRDEKILVAVETNGSYVPVDIWPNVDSWIFDYKLPSSGMEKHMKPEYFDMLTDTDIVKFVCQDHKDYNRMKYIINHYGLLDSSIHIAVSAALPLVPATLVTWLQKDKLFNIVLNTQIHKWVFPEGETEKRITK